MAGFTTSDPVAQLQSRLLARMPELEPFIASAVGEHEEPPQSEYWLLSYAVRPYLNWLLHEGRRPELQHAWEVLERLAVHGPDSAKNELFVVLEELRLWKHYAHMGPVLRQHWFDSITWYPTQRTPSEPLNSHIDPRRYRERWAEEISRVGGFTELTDEEQSRISGLLGQEFALVPWTMTPRG